MRSGITLQVISPHPPFFFVTQQPMSGLGHLIVEVSSSHKISWLQSPLPTEHYSKHKTQTSVPSAGFEPVIPAIKQLQIYDLDHSATRIGLHPCYQTWIWLHIVKLVENNMTLIIIV